MSRLNGVNWIALILVIIGGINWGLQGVIRVDLVASILGVMTVPSRIVYTLVGISAIHLIFILKKIARP